MKTKLISIFIFSFFTFISCVPFSGLGDVIIPANQELVFSPSENPLSSEKYIFLKIGEVDMYITKEDIIKEISYLKSAFPNKDIVVEYAKIKNGDKIKFEARFARIADN